MAITADEAKRYTAAAGDALTAERVARQRAEAERDEARAEAKQAHADYERVCVTVARMHAAALGEVRSPIVGLVEDVAAVRAERDAALAQAAYLQQEYDEAHNVIEAGLERENAALAQVEGLRTAARVALPYLGVLQAARLHDALLSSLSSTPAPAVYTREQAQELLRTCRCSRCGETRELVALAAEASLDAHPAGEGDR